MKNPCKQALIAAAMSVAIAVPQLASAEVTTGVSAPPATAVTTDVHVDFRVIIPGVLRFQVGSNTGIDLIEFAPTLANLGTGTDVAATAGSGDQGNGAVTVAILANTGPITINHDSNGRFLTDGTNNIPYTEILTASSDTANLDAPKLGIVSSINPPSTGSLTNASATWTYTYDNTATYPSGIYGGINTNGGRVMYTASSP